MGVICKLVSVSFAPCSSGLLLSKSEFDWKPVNIGASAKIWTSVDWISRLTPLNYANVRMVLPKH